ncbi:DnaT-like ssDNA-binding domain-containing protein [Halomonas sp. I1]|uniref:DnaT-like ssDNA-binding domain-containing protein n=1 Tax=Halomonas sp. I1 TaxID=393536 RepID=UPI0028DDB7E1|nr:DnaT-like ssDNA-binding domain-containing protein [Halomonas sp. I1]MDT8895457.1 DnaT-like ssDNA-binding domain-containing protein [Halomonas sp. I1]
MQYFVAINQARALEWGLNAQQAMLFAFLHQVPTWAESRQIDGQTYFNIGKGKIVAELPLLTDKPDTAYRLMKQLAKAGLIQMTSCDNRTYMRLTAKGATWNRVEGSENSPTLEAGADEEGSEKNPTPEKSPSRVGKISEGGSEKSPTNQYTNISTSLSGASADQPEPEQPTDHPIFGQAAGQNDDGQPSAGDHRVAMTLDWRPDPEVFAMACQRAGLPADTEYSPAQLAKFTAHHADAPGRRYGESAWVARFVDWIRNDARHAQAVAGPATGGQPHGQRTGHAGQRQRFANVSASEARRLAEQRRREQASGSPGGDVFDGELASDH